MSSITDFELEPVYVPLKTISTQPSEKIIYDFPEETVYDSSLTNEEILSKNVIKHFINCAYILFIMFCIIDITITCIYVHNNDTLIPYISFDVTSLIITIGLLIFNVCLDYQNCIISYHNLFIGGFVFFVINAIPLSLMMISIFVIPQHDIPKKYFVFKQIFSFIPIIPMIASISLLCKVNIHNIDTDY
jgi:hypothetical protein